MKRRVFSVLVALALCLSLLPGTALAEGTTTKTPDLTIDSVDALKEFRDKVNAGTESYAGQLVQLGADINLNNEAWTPIGTADHPFQGTFDGNNKTISGLKVTAIDGITYYGLFGYVEKADNVENSGIVKNLAVSGSVSVNAPGTVYVGGIAGRCYGTIQDCQFNGSVSGSGNIDNYVGGVAGSVDSISNCYNTGSVRLSGSGDVGGLAGDAIRIENSYNTGTVSGSGKVGGVVGYASSISNSYNTGTVRGSGNVGGVAAYVYGGVSNSYNTGNVSLSGSGNVGGVAGQATSTVSHCFYLTGTTGETNKGVGNGWGESNTTPITAEQFAEQTTFPAYDDETKTGWDFTNTWVMSPFGRPLLAWEKPDGTEKKPYRLATTVELKNFRDLVNEGNASYNDKHYQLAADLDLNNVEWAPIGKNASYSFKGTFDGNGKSISGLKIDVTGGDGDCYGLFGYIGTGGTVKNLAVSGSVSVTNTTTVYVGGIVGYCYSTIQNCQFSGKVSGSGNNSKVGGVAGFVYTIENSYNTGTVSGTGDVGGVAGFVYTIENSYDTGTVSGTGNVGGVAGYVINVTSCFYLTGTTGETNKGVGNGQGESDTTPITAEQFAEQTTFPAYDDETETGWDFTNTWVMSPFGRPLLAWETASASADGSENNPYQIASVFDLERFQDRAKTSQNNGKYYQLTADLNLNNKEWEPIGSSGTSFYGTFDGNGHTISGLNVTAKEGITSYGLFSSTTMDSVGKGGVVKNLAVSGKVSVTSDDAVCVGGIVGNAVGTIQNCHFSGSVSGSGGNGSYFGGLAGFAYNIENSYNTSTVSGNGNVGGLAGFVSRGVSNSYNTGNVTSSSQTNSNVGSVAGYVDVENTSDIANCYYQSGTADTGVGKVEINNENHSTPLDGIAPAEKTKFESGEIAWKLQGTQTTQVWGQALPGQAGDSPMLTTDEAKTVYQVAFDPDETANTAYHYAYTNPGGKVTLPTTPTNGGDIFNGWFTEQTGGDVFDASTTVNANTKVYSQWTPAPPSSGGGGGGGSTPSTPSITVPVSSNTSSVSVKAEVSNGNASVEISDKQINQVAAEGAENVTVDLTGLNNVESATLPAHVVETTSNTEDVGLTVALPTGSVSLDSTALSSLPADQDVTVSVKRVPATDLNEQQQAAVGDMANIGIVVDVDVFVGNEKQSNFNGGKLTISVPYTPKKNEDPSKMTVWYIKDDGTIQPMGGYYDAEKKCFVFKTTHLSRYVIVSVEDMPSFTDVPADAYYADAVTWAVLNGITTGMTETTFGPDVSCTRAQIVTFLWRAAGQPEVQNTENPFSDVSESDYFYQAVLWAVENKITTGTTATTFAPEDTCTRAQAAAFLYRNEQANGGGFTDAWAFQLPFTDVPDWCYEAVAWCYMNGVTQGTSETTFSPNLDCTRAQIVTMLYRAQMGQ